MHVEDRGFARQRLVRVAVREGDVEPFLVAGLEPEADSAAERFALALTGQNRAGKISFGTEAGLFQRAGISAVVCGPGHIAQAHKPNEFIELEQVEACTAFMRRLIDRLRRPL